MGMVLPMNYAEIEQEEMMYLDGGMSAWTKAAIIGAVVVAGVALTTALVYGQFYLAAKIMGVTMKGFVEAAGAKAVTTVIAGTLLINYSTVASAIKYVAKL